VIPGKSYTPNDVIAAAWRRRWWIVVPFAALATVALGYAMSVSYNYRSIATIQVLPDSASALVRDGAQQQSVGDRLSSIGQETLTRTRLERIISDLDLYAGLRQSTVMENVIARMRSDITFQMTDRDMFQLGYTARDPQVALATATRLTALFLDENARSRRERADAETTFLDTQLEEARTKLEAQERKLEAYRLQHSGELPSQLQSNVQEVNNNQMRLRALQDLQGRDNDQKVFLQRQLEFSPATDNPGGAASVGRPAAAGNSGAPGDDGDDLAGAKANLRALELRLTPEHPDVQRAKQRVATLLQLAAADRGVAGTAGSPATNRRNPRTMDIQNQIDVLDRQTASRAVEERQLRARIDEYNRRVDAAPLRESEITSLNRDYDDTKRMYSSLLQRRQDAGMRASLERKDVGDRFQVLDPARLPEKPFSPSRRNYFAVGLLAALVFSLTLAAVIEYRDSSMRTDEDVTVSLRLPVLATIPVLNRPVSGGTR